MSDWSSERGSVEENWMILLAASGRLNWSVLMRWAWIWCNSLVFLQRSRRESVRLE